MVRDEFIHHGLERTMIGPQLFGQGFQRIHGGFGGSMIRHQLIHHGLECSVICSEFLCQSFKGIHSNFEGRMIVYEFKAQGPVAGRSSRDVVPYLIYESDPTSLKRPSESLQICYYLVMLFPESTYLRLEAMLDSGGSSCSSHDSLPL